MDLLKSGSRTTSEDGSSWTNWWLFPRLTDDQLEQVMDEENIRRYSGGPGQQFSSHPYVKRGKRWTLITQSQGWDV